MQLPTVDRRRRRRSWLRCLADIEEVSNQTSVLVFLSVLLCLKSLLHETQTHPLHVRVLSCSAKAGRNIICRLRPLIVKTVCALCHSRAGRSSSAYLAAKA